MYWSLFWRAFILILAFNLIEALALKNTALFNEMEYVQWKAPILWSSLAFILLTFWLISRKSLLSLMFGKRLGKGDDFWTIANHLLIATLVILSLLSILVAKLFSFEIWSYTKLLLPFLGLVIFSFLATNLAAKTNA